MDNSGAFAFTEEEASFIDPNWGNWGDLLDCQDPPVPSSSPKPNSTLPPFATPRPPAPTTPLPIAPAASLHSVSFPPTPSAIPTTPLPPAPTTSLPPPVLSTPKPHQTPGLPISSLVSNHVSPPKQPHSSRSSYPPSKSSASGRLSNPLPTVATREVLVERNGNQGGKREEDGGEVVKPQTPKAVRTDTPKLLFTKKTGKMATNFQPGSALKLTSLLQSSERPPLSAKKPPVPPSPLPLPPAPLIKSDFPSNSLKRKTENPLQSSETPIQASEKRPKLTEAQQKPEKGNEEIGLISVPDWLEDAVGYMENRIAALDANRAVPKPQTAYPIPLQGSELMEQRKRENIAIATLHLEVETLYCQLINLMRDFDEGGLLEEALEALSLV